MLAPEFGVDPFEAFLAGLVQNAGLQTALRLMDQVAGDSRSLGSTIFCARLARLGRLISAGIAEEWRFPSTIVNAIREQDEMKKGAMSIAVPRLTAIWYKLYFYDRSVCGFTRHCNRHGVKFVTMCNAFVRGYSLGR